MYLARSSADLCRFSAFCKSSLVLLIETRASLSIAISSKMRAIIWMRFSLNENLAEVWIKSLCSAFVETLLNWRSHLYLFKYSNDDFKVGLIATLILDAWSKCCFGRRRPLHKMISSVFVIFRQFNKSWGKNGHKTDLGCQEQLGHRHAPLQTFLKDVEFFSGCF